MSLEAWIVCCCSDWVGARASGGRKRRAALVVPATVFTNAEIFCAVWHRTGRLSKSKDGNLGSENRTTRTVRTPPPLATATVSHQPLQGQPCDHLCSSSSQRADHLKPRTRWRVVGSFCWRLERGRAPGIGVGRVARRRSGRRSARGRDAPTLLPVPRRPATTDSANAAASCAPP